MERFQNPSRPVPLPINNFLHGRDGLCSFLTSLERKRENPSASSLSAEPSDATTRKKEKEKEEKIRYLTGG